MRGNSWPGQKTKLLTLVRELTALDSNAALALIGRAPVAIVSGLSAEDANYIRAKLADAGATASLR